MPTDVLCSVFISPIGSHDFLTSPLRVLRMEREMLHGGRQSGVIGNTEAGRLCDQCPVLMVTDSIDLIWQQGRCVCMSVGGGGILIKSILEASGWLMATWTQCLACPLLSPGANYSLAIELIMVGGCPIPNQSLAPLRSARKSEQAQGSVWDWAKGSCGRMGKLMAERGGTALTWGCSRAMFIWHQTEENKQGGTT